MAEIPGKLNELQLESFSPKKADSEISRIRLIELMNFLDRESYHVGDVVESFLTYDQFRSIMGNTWTIAQGQNIQLSDLGQIMSITTLGDLASTEGMFAQVADESDLGAFRQGKNKSHFHNMAKGSNNTSDWPDAVDSEGTIGSGGITTSSDVLPDAHNFSSNPYLKSYISNQEPIYGNSSNTGGNFKGDSHKINYFVKVNASREWIDD